MMNKIKISAFLLIMTIVVLCSTACNGENKWIPSVQGSHVAEMPYEAVDGDFVVEKFTDFNSFKKSSLADYNFISQRTAKEERYSNEFFKTRDLAVIKFNKPESGIKYTVIDAAVDGNNCTVSLLPVKHIADVQEQETTYYCFLETEKDISQWNIELEIMPEVVHESLSFSYISPDNSPYIFENENCAAFKITSKAGVDDFFKHDEIMSKPNYIHTALSTYSDEVFERSALLLIRVPSMALEKCAAYIDGGNAEIVSAKSNHYYFSWDKSTESSKLITIIVPKDYTPENIIRTSYTEYDDNADNQAVRGEYAISGTTVITDNLTRFDFK